MSEVVPPQPNPLTAPHVAATSWPASAAAPLPGYAPAPPQADGPRRPATLGVIALVLAIVTTVGAAIAAGIAGTHVAAVVSDAFDRLQPDADLDWSIFTPVRDWVVLGELAFWIGTALGITALVAGAVATGTRRGGAQGIAAIVVAALGPVVYGIVLVLTLGTAPI